uniref:Uncharacterized protein n=1 Tax=Pararge aegeria TaxID=116150 RepID=S4PWD1_9NEOP
MQSKKLSSTFFNKSSSRRQFKPSLSYMVKHIVCSIRTCSESIFMMTTKVYTHIRLWIHCTSNVAELLLREIKNNIH